VKAGAFYGDLWAEALAIDIFSLFLEEQAGLSKHCNKNTCQGVGSHAAKKIWTKGWLFQPIKIIGWV